MNKKSTARTTIRRLATKALLAAGILSIALHAHVAAASDAVDLTKVKANLRMATTALSSNGQILGSAMCSVVSKHLPNLRTSVIITGGSGENAYLLQDKDAELAIMTPDVSQLARLGQEPYGKIVMYSICKTFTNQTIFCVREDSGITSIEQLKGKRVAVAPVQSGPHQLAISVLDYGYGMWNDIEKVFINTSEAPDALKDGTVDAMVAHLSSFFPAAYLSELDAGGVKIRYLGQSDEAIANMQKVLPFQIRIVQEAATTRLKQLKEDIVSSGNTQYVAVRPDVPEDVVYAFTKTLFENAQEMDSFHALGATIRKETALDGVDKNIPVHPGAARYYKEIGVWNDEYTVGEIVKK